MTTVAQPTAGINISLVHLAQAVRAMREDCQYAPGELEAINKASVELLACSPEIPGINARHIWQWDGETLLMPSRHARDARYYVRYDSCTCAAGKKGQPCWHAAAFRLLTRAAEFTLTPTITTVGAVPTTVRRFSDTQYAAMCADNDDLF